MTAPLVWSPRYEFDWPGHVFPTGKYRRVADRLVAEGHASAFHEPEPAGRGELTLCHTEAWLDRLDAIADGRSPWDPSFEVPVSRPVLEAFRVGVGGTILAARLALRHRLAANLGGGFHHAFPDRGEGFCLLNDVPVAIRALRAEGLFSRALVVDLDVHQGNGTAVMCRDDPLSFTLSVHQERNYPVKEVSDLDVGLTDLTDDRDYLDVVAGALARVGRSFAPEVVFYLAGADPYREDRLGGLALTKVGLAARDRLVFDWARGRDAAVVALLAGGYARREEDVVDIHVRMLVELLRRARTESPGLEA